MRRCLGMNLNTRERDLCDRDYDRKGRGQHETLNCHLTFGSMPDNGVQHAVREANKKRQHITERSCFDIHYLITIEFL